jgi:2,3-dihydroxybenzoate decarboxylase
MKKIALEEHFIAPGFEEYCEPTVADLDRAVYSEVFTRLRDFGDLRLEGMDQAGIELSVLSVITVLRNNRTHMREGAAVTCY